ncbi:MAG: hypothetical protein IPG66_07510 [Hydrogenophilales bacterium]|nr:hypothetical protein [Hydrogenophilales bacterium]
MGLVAKCDSKNKAQGVAGLTGKDADRMTFKVPTLRNVEMTYPYFHDGEADSLEKAVDIMGKLQVGRTHTPDEIAKIVAFHQRHTETETLRLIGYASIPLSEVPA